MYQEKLDQPHIPYLVSLLPTYHFLCLLTLLSDYTFRALDSILSRFFSPLISFIPNLDYACFDIFFSCGETSPILNMLPAIVHQIGNQQCHGAQMWYMNPSVSESKTVLLQLGLKIIQLFLDVVGLVDLGPT